jgi:hypothetical protein
MRSTTRVAVVLAALAAFAGGLVLTPPSGPRSMRSFQPARVADLEVHLWQAYYAKQRLRLFALLVTMLREQYRYSWATATVEGFHLARATATFADLTGDYEQVLPDLEAAYRTTRSWTGAAFDPRAVAKAELAWWVARRVPGRNSADQVGSLMADEYALLYETSRDRVANAALLRAEAAALRDAQPDHPDWDRIGRLLLLSYRDLSETLATANV